MSLTRGHSCVLCQQRKIRCDQQKPCTNCVRARVECKVVPPQPARRRRKMTVHERALIERLKKYERLMTQHGIEFDSIGDSVADLEAEIGGLTTSPEDSNAQDRGSRKEGSKNSSKWYAFYDEYRTTFELLHPSSDEEMERPPIHHAFDTMFNNIDTFPFFVGGSPTRITHLHPSAVHIFQLWQIYLNNVNPLLKINHASTLQIQIVTASADLTKISKHLEALMFCIYLIAVKSMTDEESRRTFGEPKTELLARYSFASQQALVNSGFMRSNELMVLQAYFLYLHSSWRNIDPRSLFCLIGIAVRIATRLGIHRDGSQFDLPPFEAEQRRRLWWQIAALDKRIAEMTGSAITALSSAGADCRLPLNVNDTDLHPDATDPPTPYTGPTEMLFCLTRVELLIAGDPRSIRLNPATIKNPQKHSGPTTPPDTNSHNDSRPSSHELDRYCSYIESVYLKRCDPKIPMHLLTLMETRSALCKLRVVDFMCRGIPTDRLNESERDTLFLTAIQMLEYDDIIYSTESLRGFLWYTEMQAPLPGYIFLLSELRQRTTGELCERAWKAICNNHDHRSLFRSIGSPMHTSFGDAALRAWDAHEEAELRLGRAIETPTLIYSIRQRISSGMNGFQKAAQLADIGSAISGAEHVNPAAAGPSIDSGILLGPKRTDEESGPIRVEDMTFPSLSPESSLYGPFVDCEPQNWTYMMHSGAFGGFFGGSGPNFPQGGGY